MQVLTVRPRGPSVSATGEGASHATPRASVFSGTAGHGWSTSVAGEASRTDGTYVIASEDRGAVDVRAGSDYMSALATAGVTTPSGWSLRVRGDGLGESRQNGTPLQTNSTEVRQARFDFALPLGGGQLDSYGQLGDQIYRQAFSSIAASRATETLTIRQRVPASQFGYGLTWRRLFGASDLLVGAETREIVASNQETAYLPDGRVRSFTDVRGFQRSSGVFAQVRATLGTRTTVVAGARGDAWQRQRGSLDGAGVVSPRVSVSYRVAERLTIQRRVHLVVPSADVERALPRLQGRQRRDARQPGARTGGTLERRGRSPPRATARFGADHGVREPPRRRHHQRDAFEHPTVDHAAPRKRRHRDASGVEAEGEYRLRAGLTVLGALALTHARFVDTPSLSGNRVPQVPLWQGTGGVRWITSGGLAVQTEVRAFGDQFEDDRNTLVLRQAVLVDVSVSRAVTRRVAAFAAAENLFEHRVRHGRTPTRTIGTPLTARAGVRLFLP